MSPDNRLKIGCLPNNSPPTPSASTTAPRSTRVSESWCAKLGGTVIDLTGDATNTEPKHAKLSHRDTDFFNTISSSERSHLYHQPEAVRSSAATLGNFVSVQGNEDVMEWNNVLPSISSARETELRYEEREPVSYRENDAVVLPSLSSIQDTAFDFSRCELAPLEPALYQASSTTGKTTNNSISFLPPTPSIQETRRKFMEYELPSLKGASEPASKPSGINTGDTESGSSSHVFDQGHAASAQYTQGFSWGSSRIEFSHPFATSDPASSDLDLSGVSTEVTPEHSPALGDRHRPGAQSTHEANINTDSSIQGPGSECPTHMTASGSPLLSDETPVETIEMALDSPKFGDYADGTHGADDMGFGEPDYLPPSCKLVPAAASEALQRPLKSSNMTLDSLKSNGYYAEATQGTDSMDIDDSEPSTCQEPESVEVLAESTEMVLDTPTLADRCAVNTRDNLDTDIGNVDAAQNFQVPVTEDGEGIRGTRNTNIEALTGVLPPVGATDATPMSNKARALRPRNKSLASAPAPVSRKTTTKRKNTRKDRISRQANISTTLSSASVSRKTTGRRKSANKEVTSNQGVASTMLAPAPVLRETTIERKSTANLTTSSQEDTSTPQATPPALIKATDVYESTVALKQLMESNAIGQAARTKAPFLTQDIYTPICEKTISKCNLWIAHSQAAKGSFTPQKVLNGTNDLSIRSLLAFPSALNPDAVCILKLKATSKDITCWIMVYQSHAQYQDVVDTSRARVV
ncbi:hypothetical protein BJY04DRAFT_217531 [Aspergillus karnatakaensis]|uniref:uncharacterized protein n=1 Tax=Aspergillus karnatakaensis TaxID=1810916 RepID=UPI003CCCDCB2